MSWDVIFQFFDEKNCNIIGKFDDVCQRYLSNYFFPPKKEMFLTKKRKREKPIFQFLEGKKSILFKVAKARWR